MLVRIGRAPSSGPQTPQTGSRRPEGLATGGARRGPPRPGPGGDRDLLPAIDRGRGRRRSLSAGPGLAAEPEKLISPSRPMKGPGSRTPITRKRSTRWLELYLQNDRENAAEEAAERLAQQPGWEARGSPAPRDGTRRAERSRRCRSRRCAGSSSSIPRAAVAAPRPVRPFRLLLARSLLEIPPARGGPPGAREPPCPRTGRRGLMAAWPLLHPGTGLGPGRRPARAGRFLSRRASARI